MGGEHASLCNEVIYPLRNEDGKIKNDELIAIKAKTQSKKSLRCSIQTHSLLDVPGAGRNTDRYKLAFLELDEKNKKLAKPKQLTAIQNLLSRPKSFYVIVFVHGWRHDADIGNRDVRRFRKMLAYARRFMNEPGRKHMKDTELVGIYVGWRGRLFREPTDGAEKGPMSYIWSGLSIPTFWSRKRMSEDHAPLLIETLDGISELLNVRDGNSRNKMLIVGHSFGGNMLATGLKKRAVAYVKDHPPGTKMKPLLGNLVVLLNPAAEAEKWTAIQAAMREKTKMIDVGGPTIPPTEDWMRSFPQTQRPTYISITATENWSDIETKKIRENNEKVDYDFATGTLFTWAHFWRFDSKRNTTIGHLVPKFKADGTAIRKHSYGATHELILNKSYGATTYERAVGTKSIKCDVVDGWLLNARKREFLDPDVKWPSKWDSGAATISGGRYPSLTPTNKQRSVDVQFRRGLSFQGEKPMQRRAVVPANSPFWNIRALTAVEKHGKYLNYPTWCAINQLVLDDITAEKPDAPLEK